jgi:hypothetical protein
MTEKRTVATIEVLDAISRLQAEVDQMKHDMDDQHKEKLQKLFDVEAQVKYTNGRVRELEMENQRQLAVENYKDKHQTTTVAVTTSTWDWKTVLAILLTLATAAAAIAGVAGK